MKTKKWTENKKWNENKKRNKEKNKIEDTKDLIWSCSTEFEHHWTILNYFELFWKISLMRDPGYRSTDPAWFPSPKIF